MSEIAFFNLFSFIKNNDRKNQLIAFDPRGSRHTTESKLSVVMNACKQSLGSLLAGINITNPDEKEQI